MSMATFLCHALGGACLANAAPHLAHGLSGRPFQTPFASPPAKGLSSAAVNVLWGFANLAAAYLLLGRVGDFAWGHPHDALAAGSGALAIGLYLARSFGRLHGGASWRDR